MFCLLSLGSVHGEYDHPTIRCSVMMNDPFKRVVKGTTKIKNRGDERKKDIGLLKQIRYAMRTVKTF